MHSNNVSLPPWFSEEARLLERLFGNVGVSPTRVVDITPVHTVPCMSRLVGPGEWGVRSDEGANLANHVQIDIAENDRSGEWTVALQSLSEDLPFGEGLFVGEGETSGEAISHAISGIESAIYALRDAARRLHGLDVDGNLRMSIGQAWGVKAWMEARGYHPSDVVMDPWLQQAIAGFAFLPGYQAADPVSIFRGVFATDYDPAKADSSLFRVKGSTWEVLHTLVEEQAHIITPDKGITLWALFVYEVNERGTHSVAMRISGAVCPTCGFSVIDLNDAHSNRCLDRAERATLLELLGDGVRVICARTASELSACSWRMGARRAGVAVPVAPFHIRGDDRRRLNATIRMLARKKRTEALKAAPALIQEVRELYKA